MAKDEKFEEAKIGVDGPEHPQSTNKGGTYLETDGTVVVDWSGRQN